MPLVSLTLMRSCFSVAGSGFSCLLMDGWLRAPGGGQGPQVTGRPSAGVEPHSPLDPHLLVFCPGCYIPFDLICCLLLKDKAR